MPEDQEKGKTEKQGWKTFSIAGELSVSGEYKERLERRQSQSKNSVICSGTH